MTPVISDYDYRVPLREEPDRPWIDSDTPMSDIRAWKRDHKAWLRERDAIAKINPVWPKAP